MDVPIVFRLWTVSTSMEVVLIHGVYLKLWQLEPTRAFVFMNRLSLLTARLYVLESLWDEISTNRCFQISSAGA